MYQNHLSRGIGTKMAMEPSENASTEKIVYFKKEHS